MKTSNFRYRAAKWLIGLETLMIVLLGIGNIIPVLPFRIGMLSRFSRGYSFFSPEMISFHRSLSTIIGIILIFISYRLYNRMKMAWVIAMCLLPVSLLLRLRPGVGHLSPFLIFELVIMILLLLTRKKFTKKADPINLKWGILLACFSVVLVFTDTVAGFWLLHSPARDMREFAGAVYNSFYILVLMDPDRVTPRNFRTFIYAQSVICIYWVMIVATLFLILKPLVYQPIISRKDREKVRRYLGLYGSNPISYVAIEDDKHYFFGEDCEGVIAYVTAGGVAVCASEPICDKDNVLPLLSEFRSFCRKNELDICFCQASDKFAYEFERMGFGSVKYGEEAMFRLSEYTLSGKRAAKVRYAVNHAGKIGITVEEYLPRLYKNSEKEAEIRAVSKEWLGMKKSSELSFMLGGIGLENPLDKRYFLGYDANGVLQGFVVFTPFLNRKGYHADVTRRRKDAPVGVMEKIIVSAFRTMNEEGVEWGSLGLAPLANLTGKDGKASASEKFLSFIYENMNRFYGFKSLYHYKKNYGPTHWVTRYLYFYPNLFTPKIAYSIIKAQNPKGVTDFVFQQLRNLVRSG